MKWPGIRTPASLRTLQIVIAIFIAASIALVVASPIGLKWIAEIPGMNWANLSNVGQTYGAISALLTAPTFGGVVISLLYQARDVKISREQASRTFHHELLKMEMEDPFYMNVMAVPWGAGQGHGIAKVI
jgi:Family of unknown function (DUF6082)